MKHKKINKIFLFPLSLAVILFASMVIIFSSIGRKKIINIPSSGPVVISSPDLKLPVKSPLVITGKIDRSWVFEATFPIELFDNQGNSLYFGIGSAPNWTEGTDKFIGFTANVDFDTQARSGVLEIRNDNPSGLPENDKSIKFPVLFYNVAN